MICDSIRVDVHSHITRTSRASFCTGTSPRNLVYILPTPVMDRLSMRPPVGSYGCQSRALSRAAKTANWPWQILL